MEKSAALAANFDFDADGAAFTKSQQVQHATQQARRWHSLRSPGFYVVVPAPPSAALTTPWIGNVNNPYE